MPPAHHVVELGKPLPPAGAREKMEWRSCGDHSGVGRVLAEHGLEAALLKLVVRRQCVEELAHRHEGKSNRSDSNPCPLSPHRVSQHSRLLRCQTESLSPEGRGDDGGSLVRQSPDCGLCQSIHPFPEDSLWVMIGIFV